MREELAPAAASQSAARTSGQRPGGTRRRSRYRRRSVGRRTGRRTSAGPEQPARSGGRPCANPAAHPKRSSERAARLSIGCYREGTLFELRARDIRPPLCSLLRLRSVGTGPRRPATHVSRWLWAVLGAQVYEARFGVRPRHSSLSLHLIGAVIAEQHDEWVIARRYLSETSMALLHVAREAPAFRRARSAPPPEPHRRTRHQPHHSTGLCPLPSEGPHLRVLSTWDGSGRRTPGRRSGMRPQIPVDLSNVERRIDP